MSESVAAFFDVDGTLSRTTILDPLNWYQRSRMGHVAYGLWALRVLLEVPRYLWIDRSDRGRVNVLIYQRYAGLHAADLRAWHNRTFAENFQKRLFPEAIARVSEHVRQGHRVVFVTGGLDLVIQPLAEHLGVRDVIATRLVESDGIFTGELACLPIADAQKAILVRAFAEKHGIALDESFAYSDSHGDAAMLACVGHPVAVNPDRRLRLLATQRGWEIKEWARGPQCS